MYFAATKLIEEVGQSWKPVRRFDERRCILDVNDHSVKLTRNEESDNINLLLVIGELWQTKWITVSSVIASIVQFRTINVSCQRVSRPSSESENENSCRNNVLQGDKYCLLGWGINIQNRKSKRNDAPVRQLGVVRKALVIWLAVDLLNLWISLVLWWLYRAVHQRAITYMRIKIAL